MEKINEMKEVFNMKIDNVKIDELINLGRVKGDIMKYNPRLICIQYDPMKYIYHFRKFSIENAPFFNEYASKEKEGIFGV